MRVVLATVLSLMLAAAPATAGDALQSSTPGTVYSWQGKDVVFIPYDQATSFDRSSAGGREIMVVLPYERYLVIAETGKAEASAQASVSPSGEQTSATVLPGFDRDHVLLLVPADQLKNFSQISTGGRQIFVVMPLDQFNRIADVGMLGTPAASAATSSTTVTESREATSYPPASTSLPAAYPETGRTFFLHELGEANAIHQWYPAAAGTIIVLRDGSVLMVPDSVQIRGTLKEGNRIRGEFEQRGGENLVTWLEIMPSSAR